MSLSPAQLAKRLEGITATDATAIVGVNPYRSKLDVWFEKTGQAPPRNESQRSRWGDLLEGPIRDEYEDVHRVRVEVPGTLRHRTERWKFATPDGIVYPIGCLEPERGLEIKVHSRDAIRFGGLEYGAPGTDEVPAHELVQCMWNIDVAAAFFKNIDRWDLVVFMDGAPSEFVIDRDDELIGMMTEQCERFLVDHVRKNEPPPPDGTKAWDSWIKRRSPRQATDSLISIDTKPELRALVYQLRDLRALVTSTELERERVVQELKLAIGDRSGLTWREFGRPKADAITWRASKSHKEIEWQQVAAAMRTRAQAVLSGVLAAVQSGDLQEAAARELLVAASEALVEIASDAIVESNTKEIPGGRPFNVPRWWKKSKTDDKSDNAPSEEQTQEKNR